METQVQQLEYKNPNSLDELTKIQISETGQLSRLSSNNNSSDQLTKISQKIADFSERLPVYIVDFYREYSFPIISFTILVVVMNALKIALAVIGAIKDIPFAPTFFELIGVSYVASLIFHYFQKSDTHPEVIGEIDAPKN